MFSLINDNTIIDKIKHYKSPNWIWIEIWEMSEYEIHLVVTVNHEELCHLGEHLVLHIASADTTCAEDIADLKRHGQKLRRVLKKGFPDSNIHSNMHYK